MKAIKNIVLLLLTLFTSTLLGQEVNKSYTVTGTRFLLPLFDEFNDTFAKSNLKPIFKVTDRNPKADIVATATPNILPD